MSAYYKYGTQGMLSSMAKVWAREERRRIKRVGISRDFYLLAVALLHVIVASIA